MVKDILIGQSTLKPSTNNYRCIRLGLGSLCFFRQIAAGEIYLLPNAKKRCVSSVNHQQYLYLTEAPNLIKQL